MPVDPRLLALPSLRRQAEADARESLSFPLRDSPDGDLPWTVWESLVDYNQQRAVDHHARLLADLNRGQSQSWALRRIAELLGMEENCILTNSGIWGWDVNDETGARVRFPPDAVSSRQARHTIKTEGRTGWRVVDVSGIGGLSRPEAIAAILLHVEEA